MAPTSSTSAGPREIWAPAAVASAKLATSNESVNASHRRVVASEYWGKVYTVLDAVRYNRTDAALVRVVVPIVDVHEAESSAVSFVQSLYPRLTGFLP